MQDVGGRSAGGRGGPDRRQVLSVGAASAAGIFSLALPDATAAATGGEVSAIASVQPVLRSAEPIGYEGVGTGAVRLTWEPVGEAASYVVNWSPEGSMTSFDVSIGPVDDVLPVTADLTGLPGGSTPVAIRILALDSAGTPSEPSDPLTSATAVATGGSISTFTSGSTTYVLHTFATAGASTFTLNRARTVDYVVVGGGGGGAGDGGGGGGGGALRSGSHAFADPETVTLSVGAGGTPGSWSPSVSATVGGSSTITLGMTTYTVPGGGGGVNGPSSAAGAGGTGGDATASGAAGGAGSASGGTPGQNGSAGPETTIGATAQRFGGGGGGGIYFSDAGRFVGGLGGAGGGGNGVIIEGDQPDSPPQAGAAGTGGGGGAGSASYLGSSVGDGTGYRLPGAAGGTGTVILRYALPV